MKYLTHIGFVLLMLINVAYAEDLSIGIKEAKPFAYQEDGKWKGISVDLVERLAKAQKFTYTFVPYKTLDLMLINTTINNVDMSIAAVSMTADRETVIDFSHKYFTTSLAILAEDTSGWLNTAIWITKRILVVLLIFITSLYMVGYIIAKLEGDNNIVGTHNGAWWALVTFSTTGYGDEVPKTNKGKMLAASWIIASLFLISIFTGYVSSTLTVKKLMDSPTTLNDLYKVKVAVVSGSTAQKRLITLGIKHVEVDNIDIALSKFKAGAVKAIVHDDAMLSFEAESMNDVGIWRIENSEEDYAIVLPPKSSLTERVNFGILKIIATPEWKAIQLKYNVL